MLRPGSSRRGLVRSMSVDGRRSVKPQASVIAGMLVESEAGRARCSRLAVARVRRARPVTLSQSHHGTNDCGIVSHRTLLVLGPLDREDGCFSLSIDSSHRKLQVAAAHVDLMDAKERRRNLLSRTVTLGLKRLRFCCRLRLVFSSGLVCKSKRSTEGARVTCGCTKPGDAGPPVFLAGLRVQDVVLRGAVSEESKEGDESGWMASFEEN